MKTVSILFILICIGITSHAQESSEPVQSEISQTAKVPIYILSIKDRAMQLKVDQDTKSDLAHISPEWIKSISVLRGKEATDEYGLRGVHGVVVIQLKQDKFDRLPSSIREQLK